jgi:hypothetical protein
MLQLVQVLEWGPMRSITCHAMDTMLRVRTALDTDKPAMKAQRERHWPPVVQGNRFVLFIDDLNLDEFSQNTCEVIIAVGKDGELSCCSDCKEENFGRSVFSRSFYHAAKHLRTKHVITLSLAEKQRAASAAAAASANKKARTGNHMLTGAKTGPPQQTIANNLLGFTVVPSSEAYAQRAALHAEALRQREASERKVAARGEAMAAAAPPEIDGAAPTATAVHDGDEHQRLRYVDGAR